MRFRQLSSRPAQRVDDVCGVDALQVHEIGDGGTGFTLPAFGEQDQRLTVVSQRLLGQRRGGVQCGDVGRQGLSERGWVHRSTWAPAQSCSR